MSADDVTVNLINVAAPAGNPTDTGNYGIAVQTQRGVIGVPIILPSLASYTDRCMARVTYGFGADAAEQYFKNSLGNGVLLISRVVGPSAVAATLTLNDATTNPALTVKAGYLGRQDPGVWANGAAGGLKVQVTHPTTGFALTITLNNVVVEQSPECFSAADAIAWAGTNSTHVVITDPGATAIPAVVAATSLASGVDDLGSVVTASWKSALDVFTDDYGVMQIGIPGVTTTAVQQLVIDHCETHNRTPLPDLVDSPTASTTAAGATALTGTSRRRANVSAPWRLYPPLVTGGAPRVVPGSPSLAGILARNDGSRTSPPGVDIPASDANGIDLGAIGLSQTYTVTDRATLEAGAINRAVIDGSGNVVIEGNATLASASTDPQWVQATAARIFMWGKWKSNQVGQRFRRQKIDPNGELAGHCGNALVAEVTQPLANVEAIGNDPVAAVDAGPTVNTAATRRLKQLLADVTLQPNPTVDGVTVNVLVETI